MNEEKLLDLLTVAYEAGFAHAAERFHGKRGLPIRVAKRDDGSYYASQTERRGDYADKTLVYIEAPLYKYDASHKIAHVLLHELK
jgi:hypothetical protein